MSEEAAPPFRADQVGSLLRPAEIKKARAEVERGEMSAGELRTIEDRCIREAVARQEALGLQVVTAGEYRRGWWNHDFLGKIDGVEIELDQQSYKFVGSDDPRYTPKVRRRVRRARPMMLDHFRYLRSVARRTPKFTMPSPSILYHRGGRAAIDREAYPDLDQLWSDVGRSEEHTSELQSPCNLVCRLLLEKKKYKKTQMLDYQQNESTARVASIIEHTSLCKQHQVSEIMLQMLTQSQTAGQYLINDHIKEM